MPAGSGSGGPARAMRERPSAQRGWAAGRGEFEEEARAGRGGSVAWAWTLVLTSLCVAVLFGAGLVRVHRIRHNYRVSVELLQRERELHHVQRDYRALEAYVAAQQVRDLRRAELAKVTAPVLPAKRSSRS